MMENRNAMIPASNAPAVWNDEGFNLKADMTTAQAQFCSMTANSKEEQVKLYNAMNNPDERLSDCINMTLNVKDIYVEIVTCTNEETGEQTQCPRIVLIDAEGKSYQCVSIGIYSAIKKAIQVFGVPTWHEPVKMEVKQVTKGTRKMLTLNVVL